MTGTSRETAGSWLRPADGPEVVYEFFAPFAHVEGRYEWCRIRSPTHGVFDTFIVLAEEPVVVYVSCDEGERFMRDRFPECRTYRVEAGGLDLWEGEGGRLVEGRLRASAGPVRAADMLLRALPGAPRNVPYGGEGKPVWGSKRFTCWGVDLVLDAEASGRLVFADGQALVLDREPALLTLGSFGRVAPLPP